MDIIVKQPTTPFADIFRENPELYGHIARTLYLVVSQSFASATGITIAVSDTEFRHRTQICIRWFGIMRGDLKFPIQKCLDFLPSALADELVGKEWTPPRAGGYVVPDSAIPMETEIDGPAPWEDEDDGPKIEGL